MAASRAGFEALAARLACALQRDGGRVVKSVILEHEATWECRIVLRPMRTRAREWVASVRLSSAP